MIMKNKLYFNYLVLFSDLTIKTGITYKPAHRLQDYYQEVSSHNLKIVSFFITSPSHKAIALKIESEFCKRYKDNSMDGHRERFYNDADYIECNLNTLGYFDISQEYRGFVYTLEFIWESNNRHRILIDPIMSTKNRINALEYLKESLSYVVVNGIKPKPSDYDWAVNLCSDGYRYVA